MEPRYVRGMGPNMRVKRGQQARHKQRLHDAEIIGTCPIDGCDRELSRREIESRQHELNHLSAPVKRIAGKWVGLSDEQKAELAEFIARN